MPGVKEADESRGKSEIPGERGGALPTQGQYGLHVPEVGDRSHNVGGCQLGKMRGAK